MLAVWVSMFSVQLLHRHPGSDIQETTCFECSHHIKHPVHFSTGTQQAGACLLCQSVTIPFLCPDIISSPGSCELNDFTNIFCAFLPEGNATFSHPRAPPAAFIF